MALVVIPPRQEVLQVHRVLAASGVSPAALATAPGLDDDVSALLGGRPDPAGVADAVAVSAAEGTLEVRARATTTTEARLVAEAVGTVLGHRGAQAGGGGRRDGAGGAPRNPRRRRRHDTYRAGRAGVEVRGAVLTGVRRT